MEIEKKTEEVGPSESKREKVLKSIDKRAFLDVLMGGTKSIAVDNSGTGIKNENATTEPTVSAFLLKNNVLKCTKVFFL